MMSSDDKTELERICFAFPVIRQGVFCFSEYKEKDFIIKLEPCKLKCKKELHGKILYKTKVKV